MIRRLTIIVTILTAFCTAGQDFEGSWTLSGPSIIDPLTIEVTRHAGGFYLVKGYHYTPDPSWYGEGLEAFGCFAFGLGVDVPEVHAFRMQDSALTGFAVGYKGEELYAEGSGQVTGFQTSEVDLSGTWTPAGCGKAGLTLRLERSQDVHPAVFVATLTDGEETRGGYGVVFDEVLCVGVLGGSGRTIAVLEIAGDILKGEWLESLWEGEDYTSRGFDSGSIKLKRIEE